MCMDPHAFWHATLQVNANHTGTFTTLPVTYILYLMTWCWRQWNHTPFTDEGKHSLCRREKHQSSSPRDVATQFAGFESGRLERLRYYSRQGLPFADPQCECVVTTSAEAVEATGPFHNRANDCATVVAYGSRLSACVLVNGGHFEHKFWT